MNQDQTGGMMMAALALLDSSLKGSRHREHLLRCRPSKDRAKEKAARRQRHKNRKKK